MMNSKWHWMWTAKAWLAKALWLGGVASLLCAWAGLYRQALVLGLEPLAWYYNALIMGVLAMAGNWSAGCDDCGMCMPEETKEM